MKNVETCQLSVMLESGLPGSIDYEKYARNFFYNISSELISLNLPIPDKNAWNQMPPEIPRVICTSNDADLVFSGNNASFTLKKTKCNWNDELVRLVDAASAIFQSIGSLYKLDYRVGVVVTAQADHGTICRNVSDLINSSVSDRTEWQLSFLDNVQNGNLFVNKWERFICNRNENYSKYIIDVNTSPNSRINIRDDSISSVFEILNEILSGAYDEFTE